MYLLDSPNACSFFQNMNDYLMKLRKKIPSISVSVLGNVKDEEYDNEIMNMSMS